MWRCDGPQTPFSICSSTQTCGGAQEPGSPWVRRWQPCPCIPSPVRTTPGWRLRSPLQPAVATPLLCAPNWLDMMQSALGVASSFGPCRRFILLLPYLVGISRHWEC